MESIIEVKNLTVKINKHTILNNLSFPIYKNKITSIIGPSGCGKSTLLKTLNRSIEEENSIISGDILLEGESIYLRDKQDIKKEIGLIYQTPTPFPFSIYKNMTYALEYFGVKNKEKLSEIVKSNLEKAGLYKEVSDKLNMDARDLSGGQQQRLCIARSLTVNPKVILLDEPCSSLDIKNTLNIEKTLMEIKENCSVIIVTHNLSQASRISDYTIFMDAGEVVEFDSKENIFLNPKLSKTKEYINYIGG